jgi:hypothetical protein
VKARVIRTEPFRSEFRYHAAIDGELVGTGYLNFADARFSLRAGGWRFGRDGEPEFVIVSGPVRSPRELTAEELGR